MRISDCVYNEVCTNNCTAGCIRYLEMKYLLDSSNIPKARQSPVKLKAPECDYNAYTRLANIKDNITDFVKSGKSLYITSNITGNGKTTWAIKLMLKYFDNIWAGNGFKARGVFIHTPTFLLKCKDFSIKDDDFERLRQLLSSVDCVIFDDIASTDISAYDYSQLLMYIDIRTSNKLCNIYTGNLVTEQELQKALGAKLTSRILSKDTEVIVFKGGDKR